MRGVVLVPNGFTNGIMRTLLHVVSKIQLVTMNAAFPLPSTMHARIGFLQCKIWNVGCTIESLFRLEGVLPDLCSGELPVGLLTENRHQKLHAKTN